MSTLPDEVRGVDLDAQTRCAHYHSDRDIVAIRMMCCGVYYACVACHAALAGHSIERWPRDRWDAEAIRCGNCRAELSIATYMAANDACPACQAKFNPGCRDHYHYYFADRSEGHAET